MKKIITVNKMDIKTAVNHIANEIHLGARGLFADTEFGRIPVEVCKESTPSSFSCLWDEAPSTQFVMINRQGSFQYYVKIVYVHGQDICITKRQLIREFSKVMLLNLGYYNCTDGMTYTLVKAYLDTYEKYNDKMSNKYYANAYVKSYGGIGTTLSPSTRHTFHKEVLKTLKCEDEIARVTLDICNEIPYKTKLGIDGLGDTFYNTIAAFTILRDERDYKDRIDFIIEGFGNVTSYDILHNLMTEEY